MSETRENLMSKKDKGKGKLIQESESEPDEDFYVSDQELYESDSDIDSSEEGEDDEIAALFEEAEENGDRGDLVLGLRSGKAKRPIDQVIGSSNQGSYQGSNQGSSKRMFQSTSSFISEQSSSKTSSRSPVKITTSPKKSNSPTKQTTLPSNTSPKKTMSTSPKVSK
jgi:hypothetical protein